MADFKYRLQVLYDQKEELKKQADQELLLREKELEAEREKLEELRRHMEELTAKRVRLRREILAATVDGKPLTADEVNQRSTYVKALGLDIEAAKDDMFSQRMVVEESEERVEAAKTHVAECKREVEVLTKHRAKLEQRFLQEMQAKEDLELDEVGNMLYVSRKRQT